MNLIFSAFARRANALVEVYSKSRRPAFKTLGLALTALLFAVFCDPARAATFTVTTTGDSGAGSLRQAVIDANNAAGADTIVFSPAVFGSVPRVINLSSEIGISTDLTIDGTGRRVFLNGSVNSRPFAITNAVVTLRNLSIVGGRANGGANGGCLLVNGGTTNIFNSYIFNCQSQTGGGGGIYLQAGNLNINNTTFSNNFAGGSGGSLMAPNANSVVSIVSSTFAGSFATGSGGGLATTGAQVSARNTLFADNGAATGPDFSGTLNSQGYNLISDANGVTITGVTLGNRLNINAQIDFDAPNGGDTQTRLPLRTSPAVDAGDPALASTKDQRGARRGPDGNIDGIGGVDIGAAERQRTAFDNEGNGSADFGVIRAGGGNSLIWYGGFQQTLSRPENLTPTPNALRSVQFGLSGDVPAPADYDGDGITDEAVFRGSEGVWYVRGSSAGVGAFRWGLLGDLPVPADYDGDGRADFAVYRAGVWYIFKSRDGYTGAFVLGAPGDLPAPADFDGDLRADPAVFSGGIWSVVRSTNGPAAFSFGLSGDIPVPADYDGDGRDNLAIFRPASGTWYIERPTGGFDAVPFGLATDRLVPADYDGDGRVDIAVRRANAGTGGGDWYINQSRDGLFVGTWGLSGDQPTANALIRQ